MVDIAYTGRTACSDMPGWDTKHCCSSCHKDWEEYGSQYPMCEYYAGDHWITICCACAEDHGEDAQKFVEASWAAHSLRKEDDDDDQ